MNRIAERRLARYRAFAEEAGQEAVGLAMFHAHVTDDGIEAAVAFAEEAGHFANLVIDLSAPRCVGFLGRCDGDLIGEPHASHCPRFGYVESWR